MKPKSFCVEDELNHWKYPVVYRDSQGKYNWLNSIGKYLCPDIELKAASGFPVETISVREVLAASNPYQSINAKAIQKVRDKIKTEENEKTE